jgi:hypothetical protein
VVDVTRSADDEVLRHTLSYTEAGYAADDGNDLPHVQRVGENPTGAQHAL